MEFKFVAPDRDGKPVDFVLDDLSIDYFALRMKLSEDICIEAIEQIKKRSGKKCAILFGNCQKVTLQSILLNHLKFRSEYFFVTLPAVYTYGYNGAIADLLYGSGGAFLKLCDLFISQHVKGNNRFHPLIATKNIAEKFNENTKIIWIPNVYFDGYFPQFTHVIGSDLAPFIHRDKYVDEIMERSEMNPDVEKILDQIQDENFIPPAEIRRHVDNSLAELKTREWTCDIKMADYIETNFQPQQIFFSPNHPVPLVVFELAKRILRFIGIQSENFVELKNMLDDENRKWALLGQDIPIYSAVKKCLGIEKVYTEYYANLNSWKFRGNFRDYMRQYILKCWHEKFSQ